MLFNKICIHVFCRFLNLWPRIQFILMYVLWVLKRECGPLLFDGLFCKCQLDPVALSFSVFLLTFYLVVLSMVEERKLKSPTITADVSITAFSCVTI